MNNLKLVSEYLEEYLEGMNGTDVYEKPITVSSFVIGELVDFSESECKLCKTTLGGYRYVNCEIDQIGQYRFCLCRDCVSYIDHGIDRRK